MAPDRSFGRLMPREPKCPHRTQRLRSRDRQLCKAQIGARRGKAGEVMMQSADDLYREAFYRRFDAAAATLSPDVRARAHLGGFMEEKDGSWEMYDQLGERIAQH